MHNKLENILDRLNDFVKCRRANPTKNKNARGQKHSHHRLP